MNPVPWIPLSLAATGRAVVLRRIQPGGELNTRLAAMGLLPGVAVNVCRNDRSGPVVLGLNGSRIMLGRGMAARISVQEDGAHA